jgi:hypothetical protein
MLSKFTKPVFLLICIVGLIFLPMADIFLYNRPMSSSAEDFIRATSERVEYTDYHSSDISTFVNDQFIFYVPPPINREIDRPRYYYDDTTSGYIIANLSTIQIFSYENGAKVTIEWLNATVLNGTTFTNNRWYFNNGVITWLDELPQPKTVKKKITLGEYETEEIQLNAWLVHKDFRILSGVVRIESDSPISVMHHRLYPVGTLDNNGYEMINYYWDGIYSAYGKKLFTRITGDCWISALEAGTTVHVWDYSDKNDDEVLSLDRFEGWAYSRNAIFEQYGFDDDLVLISADKPVSIVAGNQADQGFVQVFGKDGKDYLFPCFGKVLIHAPNGATIDLKDKSGNQGSYKGTLEPGEMKVFDFKVAYKLRRHSSYEWAELRSSEPIMVYSFAYNQWYLNEDYYGFMSGEEYVTTYKKITEYYPHGYVPYPADTEFEVPLRSRAYVTVVNLDKNNNVRMDFSDLVLPFDKRMDPYEPLTIDFSENSYYSMDMFNDVTQNMEDPKWLYNDPYNRYDLNHLPSIAVHNDYNTAINDKEQKEAITYQSRVEWDNITKGSTVKIKADHPVLLFINYNKDQSYYPQGVDLIPGLTPPVKRGLPEAPALIVAISGVIIAADVILITVGKRSMVELF